ncbi:helix-turn-helix transcriptional regulator [Micromonospora polyrhachis]|uniref:Transcriptional regulator with XRE-family HTH domain n=1 Tax=Micromonospora polyrhachis TaxID=1282883 RepID=A0A7W7WPD1_9ACTN|nr:helix-turn-helix transcriptional regulator [Micromonospora polyrhachis]MBB4958805.1 transcriptional regulator with XRE-family HTH domain [Micromonospora polyrhachis]
MTEEQPTNVDFLLAELRRARKHAGLSQEEQGRRMGYSASMVAMVETGGRRLPPDYLPLVDKALDTGGLFVRLGEQLRVDETPQWRRQRDALEREASSLRWFEHAYVPGLLQTEDYARAVFSRGGIFSADEVERRVADRLARQDVLIQPNPPQLVAVIDEGVLHRPVGGRKVIQHQLLHLAQLGTQRPRLRIHVVPRSVGEYAGLDGPFILATLPSGDEVAYLDNYLEGQVTDRPADLTCLRDAWESTLGEALTPHQSVQLIREVAETWT